MLWATKQQNKLGTSGLAHPAHPPPCYATGLNPLDCRPSHRFQSITVTQFTDHFSILLVYVDFCAFMP